MPLQIIFQASVAFAVWLFALGTIKAFWAQEITLSISGLSWSVKRWFCDGFIFFFLIKASSSWNSRMKIVTHQPSKNNKKMRGLFIFLGGFISTWEQSVYAFNVAHESQILRPLIAQKNHLWPAGEGQLWTSRYLGVPEMLISILVQQVCMMERSICHFLGFTQVGIFSKVGVTLSELQLQLWELRGHSWDVLCKASSWTWLSLCVLSIQDILCSVNYFASHSLNAAGAASVCVGMECESPKWVLMVDSGWEEGGKLFITGRCVLRFSFEASTVLPEWIWSHMDQPWQFSSSRCLWNGSTHWQTGRRDPRAEMLQSLFHLHLPLVSPSLLSHFLFSSLTFPCQLCGFGCSFPSCVSTMYWSKLASSPELAWSCARPMEPFPGPALCFPKLPP